MSEDSLTARVQSWRDPVTGRVVSAVPNGNTATVNGHHVNGYANGNGVRGRAEVRGPYSDLIVPQSPDDGWASPPSPETTQSPPQPPPAPPVVFQPPTTYPPQQYAPQQFHDQSGPIDSQTTFAGQPALPGPPTHHVPQPATHPIPPSSSTEPPQVLHYGHYGPDGQGWPVTSELPPGYRPMPTYPAAGQPGYPAAEPTYAPEPPYPAEPHPPTQAIYRPEPPPTAPTAYPVGPVRAEPIHVEPVNVQPPAAPPEPVRPAEAALPPTVDYRDPTPAAFAEAAVVAYDEPTPLFDQQPPPFEPTFDWTMPSYPSQREPSDTLAAEMPTRDSAPARPAPVSPPRPVSPAPATERPANVRPASVRPVSARPVSAQPVGAQPVSAQPVSAAPVSAAPLDAPPAPAGRASSSGPPELPQRVPAEPDVPAVPEFARPTVEAAPHAAAPDLARIAAHLRHDDDDVPQLDGRPDGFDIPAVLKAVRDVPGVREAKLRPNPGGVHTLRLELSDNADPGVVSRAVARLLNERMGLAAEPNPPSAFAPPAARPTSSGAMPAAPASGGAGIPGSPASGAGTVPGREARRRRPVSGQRRPEDAPPRPPEAAPVEPPPAPAPPAAPALLGPEVPAVDAAEQVLPALVRPGNLTSSRVMIDQVEVSTQGVDAIVEVRLIADGVPAVGTASGPAVDGYMLRLSAVAAAAAIDELLVDADAGTRGRCFIEHTALVPFGNCDVAVVVLLLTCDGWVEQLTGSSVVAGDPRQAVVRATLAAVNRRLEALLP